MGAIWAIWAHIGSYIGPVYLFLNVLTFPMFIVYMFEDFRYFVHFYLPGYNPPENKSEITNNDQICATTIKNTLNPGFYHIKYDEKYMPELF